jgi:hypothetical protein
MRQWTDGATRKTLARETTPATGLDRTGLDSKDNDGEKDSSASGDEAPNNNN